MPKINPSIFRAYDIRGIYPDELNEDTAYNIGRAYLDYIRQVEKVDQPQIVIGRDKRPSSDPIFRALANGVTDQGGDVFDIGYSTTPMLYWAVNFLTAQGGIMITASHNPASYNGLKLTREKAIPISKDSGLEIIQRRALDGKFQKREKQALVQKPILPYYVDFLVDSLQISLRGKIVIDAANGMTPLVLPQVLERLNINYQPIYFDIDCTFPNHAANPLKEETLDKLKETIKKEKAILGVAFDGDGDRVVFVTEEGEVIHGDYLTAIFAQHALSEKKNHGRAIVYGLRCSRVVAETVQKLGGKGFMTKVGYPNIKKKMREEKAILGGELSSHIYYAFDFPLGKAYFESGIYAMIKFLEILAKSQKKSSELLGPFKKYFNSGEINFETKDKDKILRAIEKAYGKKGGINKLDGILVTVKQGKNWFWFNVRPSNTEPLLRLIMESNRKETLNGELKRIESFIVENGGTRV